MRVQTLRAQAAVERFDKRIVRRFAGPAEVERDVVLIGSQIEVARDELRALIDADRVGIADVCADALERRNNIFTAIAEPRIDDRREPREQIDDGENAQLRSRRQLIVHEVHRPGLVRARRLLAVIPQFGLHAPLGVLDRNCRRNSR